MTTNLTVATASGKMRVAFCNFFFSETNSGKWKRSFTTYDLRCFAAIQTGPQLHLQRSPSDQQIQKTSSSVSTCYHQDRKKHPQWLGSNILEEIQHENIMCMNYNQYCTYLSHFRLAPLFLPPLVIFSSSSTLYITWRAAQLPPKHSLYPQKRDHQASQALAGNDEIMILQVHKDIFQLHCCHIVNDHKDQQFISA